MIHLTKFNMIIVYDNLFLKTRTSFYTNHVLVLNSNMAGRGFYDPSWNREANRKAMVTDPMWNTFSSEEKEFLEMRLKKENVIRSVKESNRYKTAMIAGTAESIEKLSKTFSHEQHGKMKKFIEKLLN
jgi:hypothetical protein